MFPIKRKQHGFAMIEVLVTSVIVAIGISGMGILLMRAIQGTQDSAQQSQAMWMVQDFVGRIRANSEGGRRSSYVIDEVTDCSVKPASICADSFINGIKVNSAICDEVQMAEFDKWITVCGLQDSVYDSGSDFIINPVLSSLCTLNSTRVSSTSGLPDCIRYNVQLTWDTKIKKGSADVAERLNKNTYSAIVELN